uniref:X-ray repair complementing defective repair in Chinese hamster cells 3 n=1 Tax=Amphilophus citrinellus TaxID=61819 RepID=A0A3Q0SVJ2_AMPCI
MDSFLFAWLFVSILPVVTVCAFPAAVHMKSVQDVVCVSGPDLQRLTGLSYSDVQQLITAAAAACRRNPPITALQLQRGMSGARLSLGCPVLDRLLRGGLPVGGVTELAGKSGAGKTQLGLQLCLSVQYPAEHGGLGAGALYVCTEDSFPIKRLHQLIGEQLALRSDVPVDLIERLHFSDHVYIEHTADLDSLQVCLNRRAPLLLARGLVRLIVVDSVAALFRAEFQADDWLERNRQLLTFSSTLHRLSQEFSTPVLCINQVRSIHPDFLKALDAVGLSWATHLCSIAWRSGVVVPIFKKGDRRVCFNFWGITLLSLPSKVYARVLERRVRPLVEPQIQEEQCGFCPCHGTLDQLFILSRIFGCAWEFAQPVYMCFVDLEKAFKRIPQGSLWEVLREYGGSCTLLRAIQSLCNRSESLGHIASD